MPSVPSPPRLSVAMCTYNGSRHLRAQLDSILAQSIPVDELIVSDDGSTDGTPDLIRECWRDRAHPRLILLEGERLGITRNFERALSACSGDLLFLCDQDDLWLPGKVEKTLAFLQDHPGVHLVFSDARLIDAEGHDLGVSQFEMVRMSRRLIGQLAGVASFATLLRRNVVTGATAAIRPELLRLARPFVDGWLHDEWLAICAAATGRLGIVAEPLVRYRQHGGNQCGMRPSSLKEKIANAANSDRAGMGAIRLEKLSERLAGSLPGLLPHLERARAFEQARARLGKARVKRIPGVLAAMPGYFSYADGWRSMLKDALAR